jgi:hypothetical protein
MAKVKEKGVDAAPEGEAKVMVLSQRPGDVKAPCGTLMKHMEVAEVSEDSAQWLEASFKGMFKRVK